jgi:hypothetical protein
MSNKKLPAHTKSSGNIFADLGLPNAEERQLKAALEAKLKPTQTGTTGLVEMKRPNPTVGKIK